MSEKVNCFVRIRPSSNFAHENIEILNDKENDNNKIIQLKVKPEQKLDSNIQHANNLQKSWRFNVNDVLYNADQSDVYNKVAKGLVNKALDGYSGTLIAYGETESGKTFTLSGARDNSDFGQRGLSPRAIGQIFQHVNNPVNKYDSFNVSISYLQIDGTQLDDLFCQSTKKLEIFEDENNPGATKVTGLSKIVVNNEVDAFKLFLAADTKRSKLTHSIFTIYISSKSHIISGGTLKQAELKFVDLTSRGCTLLYADSKIKTNGVPSLTFLEQVIVSLEKGNKQCIPWRSCPLTHVLKGSFTRMSTVLLATIYGDKQHLQGSLSTLRFAARLNNLHVSPAHNELHDANCRVKALESEILFLKDELKMRYIFNRVDDKSAPCSSYEPLTEKDLMFMQKNVSDYMNGVTHHMDVTSYRQINKLFDLMRDEYDKQRKTIEKRFREQYHFIEKSSDNNSLTAGQNTNIKSSDQKIPPADKKTKTEKSKKSGKKSSHNDNSKTSLSGSDSRNLIDQSSSTVVVNKKESLDEIIEDNGQESRDENLSEKFENFKKSSGSSFYNKILSLKRQRNENLKISQHLANQINNLVDEISIASGDVLKFESSKPKIINQCEKNIITEDEYIARKNLADKKNYYMEMRNTFNNLQSQEMTILNDLECQRKGLLLAFSEENKHSSDVFTLCNNLSVFGKDNNLGNNISVFSQDEQMKPPFAISQQKEQDDPSFNAWQGARLELIRHHQLGL